MAINLNDTWNGEKLSDVRAFIQRQLKNGYTGVKSAIVDGKVQLTFTKADGTENVIEFTAAEGEGGGGYQVSFRIKRKQQVYGTGYPVAFTYSFSQTMDGEPIPGSYPSISFEAFTTDSNGNPLKSIWTTQLTDNYSSGVLEIPVSALEGITGTIIIKGTCNASFQGQTIDVERQTYVTIATCDINFSNSFALSKHVKGYASNATMTEVFVDYVGNNKADLLMYVDGTLKTTISEIFTGQVEITLPMEGLTDGMHTVQIIAKMDTGALDESDNPIYIYSKSLLFDFYRGISGNHVGIMMTLDTANIISDPINSLTINTEQYVNFNISYAASEYDGTNKVYIDPTSIGITKNGVNVLGLAVGPNNTYTYTFRDTDIINYPMTFDVKANSRKINISVTRNSSGVSVASGAAINISCSGRNNKENTDIVNTLSFSDNNGNTYVGTLTNFSHTIQDANQSDVFIDGWDGEGLIFQGATTLNLPYKPFSKFNVNTGYYIEFNIRVNTILDSDAYIISTLDSNNKGGFYLKAEEAGIITNSGTKVFTYIAAATTYNIGFMIKKYTGTNDGKPVETILLELYVNGIRTGVNTISSSDSFNTDSTITMNGIGAIWKFYGMRVYNATLTPVAIYNNYLTTLLDGDEIVRLANENDVLNTAKTDIDYQKLINKGKNVLIVEVGDGTEQCALDSDGLGKMLSECSFPTDVQYLSTKEQFLNPSAVKKNNFLVKSLTYYNNGKLTDPYSFKCGPSLMQVQGTSSTYYSRKNYDIFFTGQKYNKKASKKVWTSKFDTTIGADAIQNVNTTSIKYSMSSEDAGVPCLCLKADYSDSSNLHNTQGVRLINDVWKQLGVEYLTPPQHTGDTIHTNVRVGINGHPIDVFVKDGNTYSYIGQYNMNNEKKDSHHVYGFDGTVGNTGEGKAICVEFLENNRTATLFNAGNDFNWETCSDTTDDSGEAIPQLEFRYPANDWVDGSEAEKAAVKRVFIWVKECYDSFISSYVEETGQYTSTKFVEEVKQYFNLKNLCAWYLYTEYFLAVDQRSKNMMLASWKATATEGIWYFLPYDSDTMLGVTNDGWLILPWNSDENTPNPMNSNQYAYMGHDSNLWKLVRYYLYDNTYAEKYGLIGYTLQDVAQQLRDESTNNTLFNLLTIKKYFNNSRKYWADIVYNFDSDTKYMAPLTYQSGRGSKSDFAQFIQGARDAHRDWLINKRFHLLDSKYACGFFISDEKNIKLGKNKDTSCQFKVTAIYDCYIQLIVNTTSIGTYKLKKGVETTITIPSGIELTTNDPFKFRGFSAIEKIDFDTTSDYILSDIIFESFSNLKTLIINATSDNPSFTGAGLGDCVKSLVNLRNLTLKGFHNKSEFDTPILDLSKNIMLETVDVNCEKLTKIVLPYSHHNLKRFNVGNLNIQVPWEFWDELNDYYARTQNSCIFVGELIDRNLTYTVYAGDSTNRYIINDKYFVYILPYKGLGFDNNTGIFGESNTTRNQVNLKSIIYAKIDSSLFLRPTDGLGISKLYSGCKNLTSINTRGWTCDFTKYDYYRDVWINDMINYCPCSEIDLSFIKLGYFKNKINYIGAGNRSFIDIASTVTYIRYGSGWFNLTVEKRNLGTTICTSVNMNAKHYVDLAEDLPDITSLDITEDAKTLTIGTNYNDFTKFPQTVRDKILAKGWFITQ